MRPFYSAAETIPGEGGWEVGEHRLQLDFWPFNHKPPATVLRRQGVPFWDYLDAAGVPSTFYDLPSQLPAQPVAPRPPPLHLRHGHARTCWAPTAPISTSPRTARPKPVDEGGRQAVAADRSRTRRPGRGSSGPENSAAQDAAADRRSSSSSIATARPTRP